MEFDRERYQALLTTGWLGRQLEYHESVGSTMDLARDWAQRPGANGIVVLAEEQTAGRGRRGRSFYSPAGENLYFTLVIEAHPAILRSLPVVVPLAVVEAIGHLAPSAAIKWPNDIWIGERKCCGMLIDIHQVSGATYALLGIGINVNGDPSRQPDLAKIATSIASATGRPQEREPLLAGVMNFLERLLGADIQSVLGRYKARSNTLGRDVAVRPAVGEAFEGMAVRITGSGALVVRKHNGIEVEVEAADVSVRPRA